MFNAAGILFRIGQGYIQGPNQKLGDQAVLLIDLDGPAFPGFSEVDLTIAFMFHITQLLELADRIIGAGLADIEFQGDVGNPHALAMFLTFQINGFDVILNRVS